MMNRYPRKPALIVVLIALTLGVVYVTAWARIEHLWKKQPTDQNLEALKRKVAEETKSPGGVSVATWRAYGEGLSDGKQFAPAAGGFRGGLAIDPAKRGGK